MNVIIASELLGIIVKLYYDERYHCEQDARYHCVITLTLCFCQYEEGELTKETLWGLVVSVSSEYIWYGSLVIINILILWVQGPR